METKENLEPRKSMETKGTSATLALALVLAGTVCPSSRAEAEDDPFAVDGMTVNRVNTADGTELKAAGQLSLAALEQRQDILEHTREQLIQVDPCWGQHEFEDDVVYYMPHEGPEGEGPRAPRVFVSGGCEEEPTPSEDDYPNGDDHDKDPPPWSSGDDADYWFTQCEESAGPNLWNCWFLQGRPCGAGGEPETTGCQPVDSRLVYPIKSNGAVVNSRCPDTSPTGLCDVLVGTFNTHTDFGPDAFEVWRDDWRECEENPQLCPEGHTILLDCISFPHLCEAEIDFASFVGPQVDQEPSPEPDPAVNCEFRCKQQHETKMSEVQLICRSFRVDRCGGMLGDCSTWVWETICDPLYDQEEENDGYCMESCTPPPP